MLSYEQALNLIQESLASLQNAGIVAESITISADTVILGSGSELDSLGFVTFISDLEERLCEETNEDIYLVLDEIGDFNINNPFLSAGTIAKYIETLTDSIEG